MYNPYGLMVMWSLGALVGIKGSVGSQKKTIMASQQWICGYEKEQAKGSNLLAVGERYYQPAKGCFRYVVELPRDTYKYPAGSALYIYIYRYQLWVSEKEVCRGSRPKGQHFEC